MMHTLLSISIIVYGGGDGVTIVSEYGQLFTTID